MLRVRVVRQGVSGSENAEKVRVRVCTCVHQIHHYVPGCRLSSTLSIHHRGSLTSPRHTSVLMRASLFPFCGFGVLLLSETRERLWEKTINTFRIFRTQMYQKDKRRSGNVKRLAVRCGGQKEATRRRYLEGTRGLHGVAGHLRRRTSTLSTKMRQMTQSSATKAEKFGERLR